MTGTPGSTGAQTPEQQPAFSVVGGHPSDEELAALAVVLGLSGRASTPPAPPAPSAWATYGRGARTPVHPGPGAWRASGRLG